MFHYEFMRLAFISGTMIACVLPLIGTTVVFKRMSMIGDALSHISLSGITLGLLMGFNPLVGAIILSLVASFSIEFIQKKLGSYQELAIAVMMSLGIGISGILMGFLNNPANFNSFLFGSIVAVSTSDFIIAIILSLCILCITFMYYRNFFYVSFDQDSALLSGVNIHRTNLLFTIITALTVSIASRIVGALIVSSLLVIPTAAAMMVSKSYRTTMLYGVIYSVISMWFGLSMSYYLDLKPGGTIVIVSVVLLLGTLFVRSFKKAD